MSKQRTYKLTFAMIATVLIATVAGSFLKADVPQVATGTWMQTAPFGDIPGGAASAILADGRVVVAGGQLPDGSLSAAVAVFDPAADRWTKVGDLLDARAGLAAAVAADGRVVIAGGRTAAGVTASVELFDLSSANSQPAGVMTLPRADAAAATLPDGRVLIAGGTDGAAALASAELFDPQTNTSQPAAPLAVGRSGLSATTLLDGHVLVAGGNDGQHDLSIAEIYDPELGIFWETEWMHTARSRHVAMRLPNSNTILVAGGTSNGVALKSAEQYAHWSQLWLAYEPLMSAARVGAIAAPTSRPGVVRIGGGGDASSEFYGYATLTTDKDDYAPYETVTISGGGWQPGETVHLKVSEDSDSHYDWELEAVADEFGNIVNQDFYPRQDDFFQHIGMRFYLSATGIAFQAQATFTDAGSIAVDPPIGPVGTLVTVSSGGGAFGGNKNNIRIFWDGGSTPLATCSTNNGGNIQGTCTFTVPAASTSGAHTVTATQQDSPALTFSTTFTVGAASGDGTMVVNPSSVTAGTSGNNFTFTFTASNAFGVGSQATISIPSGWPAPTTVNTALAGSTCTGLSRTVSSSTITVNMACAAGQSFTLTYNGITAPTTAGPYTFTTKTRQSSTGTLTNIASSPVVTVTPACTDPSMTTQPSNQSVTYGADPTFTAAASGNPAPTVQWQVSTGGSFINLPGQTSTTLTLTKPAVSPSGSRYRAVFTNTCGGTQTATSNEAILTVAAKAATVTADAKSKTYGAADPPLTGTLGGFLTADNVTASYSRVSGETVGGYVISATLAPADVLGNYAITYNTANFEITKKTASVTANDKSKTYGQANPALDAAVSGTVNGDQLDYSLATTATQFSNVGPYAITVTLGTNPNYEVSTTDGTLTIGKAPASVKANDKTRIYGDANPALDAAATGALNGDVLAYSLATSAVPTSNIADYSIVVTLGANPNYEVTPINGTLTVTKASLSIKANDASRPYGVTNPTFTGTYSGQKNGDSFTLSFSTSATTSSPVGPYPIEPSANGTTIANYVVTPTNGALTIDAWSVKGFYEPVGVASSIVSAPGAIQPSVSAATVWNSIKGGQTVPMKFNFYRTLGGAQITTVADAFTGAGFSAYQLPTCVGGYTDDEIALSDVSTGGTELRWDGTQFIQNWKTPKASGDLCYRAVVTAKDGSTITAFFKVKK